MATDFDSLELLDGFMSTRQPERELLSTFSFLRTGAPGSLAGTFPDGITSVEGVPTDAEVFALLRAPGTAADGARIDGTVSDGAGIWLIEGLSTDRVYDVIARKADERDVIASDVTPLFPLEMRATAIFNVLYGDSPTTTFTARGGEPPYTYSIVSGTLPTGVSLVGDQLVVTSPNATLGDSPITVEVEDARSDTAQRSLIVRLGVYPLVMSSSFAATEDFTTGVPVTEAVTAVGGIPTYSYAVSAGSLPAGLSLNTSTGAITGTPTVDGTSGYTITVTDAAAATRALSFSNRVGTPHAYWRMNATASNNHLSVSEMEMSSAPGGTNLCTGGTPIASGNYPGGGGYSYEAANAFNGAFPGPTDTWASLNAGYGWLGYQFASPVFVGEFRIAARALGSQSPNTFTLEWSDDGVSWTSVATYTGITAWTYSSFTSFAA